MNKWYLLIVILILTTVIGAACGTKSPAPTQTPVATISSTPVTSQGAAPVTLTSASPVPAAKPDGNYIVRIGFPLVIKDARSNNPVEIWALENGYFDQEFKADGIKVEYKGLVATGPAVVEAIAAGSLELGNIGDSPAIIGKSSGKPISLVAAVPPTSPFWLIVSGTSTIQNVNDLKGKKVVAQKGTNPQRFLLEALKASGLKDTDVQLVDLPGLAAPEALASGSVDAIVGSGTSAIALLKKGFRIIHSSFDLPARPGVSTIIASDSFIAAHPAFFPRYYKVYQKALEWGIANRDSAFAILSKEFGGVERADLEKIYPGTWLDFGLDTSPAILTQLKSTETFLFDQGLTRSSVDIDAWVNKAVAYQKP
jgi:sulfonate transport system substrate-binding protein